VARAQGRGLRRSVGHAGARHRRCEVAFIGSQHGYGNVIELHSGGFATLYAHLSRFARK
jgi:hypothetical protein